MASNTTWCRGRLPVMDARPASEGGHGGRPDPSTNAPRSNRKTSNRKPDEDSDRDLPLAEPVGHAANFAKVCGRPGLPFVSRDWPAGEIDLNYRLSCSSRPRPGTDRGLQHRELRAGGSNLADRDLSAGEGEQQAGALSPLGRQPWSCAHLWPLSRVGASRRSSPSMLGASAVPARLLMSQLRLAIPLRYPLCGSDRPATRCWGGRWSHWGSWSELQMTSRVSDRTSCQGATTSFTSCSPSASLPTAAGGWGYSTDPRDRHAVNRRMATRGDSNCRSRLVRRGRLRRRRRK